MIKEGKIFIENNQYNFKLTDGFKLSIDNNKQMEKQDSERKNMVGSGDRSEKIRTYNFPQNRITDHRIEYSIHSLEAFLDGDIDEMIETLIEENQARLLSQLESNL